MKLRVALGFQESRQMTGGEGIKEKLSYITRQRLTGAQQTHKYSGAKVLAHRPWSIAHQPAHHRKEAADIRHKQLTLQQAPQEGAET